jgi:hypothetical protein
MAKVIVTLVLAMLLSAAAVAADGEDYRANRKLRGVPVEAVQVRPEPRAHFKLRKVMMTHYVLFKDYIWHDVGGASLTEGYWLMGQPKAEGPLSFARAKLASRCCSSTHMCHIPIFKLI